MTSVLAPTRRFIAIGTVVLSCVLALYLGGQAGASGGATTRIVARVGHLEIINPFLPDPASPSVASVYLTVKNTGSQADALVSEYSPIASSTMLMTENSHGAIGTMGMLQDLRIPAHGQASLKPGHDHVMLEQPRIHFKVGHTVLVTLRFERAGSITIKVPVVPLSRMLGN